MTMPELDPQFSDYLVERPRLSYVQPDDGRLRKLVINGLELATGRDKLESVYRRLKDRPFAIESFFGDAISAGKIRVNHRGILPIDIDIDGPIIFLANHPFGIIDGIVLCDIAAQIRGDLRILLHSILCQDIDLAPYFLPVDFNDTKLAMKTNIRTKQLALEALTNDIPLLLFPSGMVSTAKKFGFGSVEDAPWTTFAAKLVKQSKATVVPIYFHGRNSRKYYLAAQIAQSMRTGLLMHEAINKFGSKVDVAIGEPIPWSTLEQYDHRQTLTDVLYNSVQSLKCK
jgi:putative hemolysin